MKSLLPGRLYVYRAPGYDSPWERTVGSATIGGHGRLKVGFTGRADSRVRIKEQTGTVYPDGEGIEIVLDIPAVRLDGSNFDDHDVHRVLTEAGIQRQGEVFEATLDEIRAAVAAVRSRRAFDPYRTADHAMRPEQEAAVRQTAAYFRDHANDQVPPRFLWNAKMRFGKTFSTYQLAREMGWRRILVLTYQPAVRTSWADDLRNHVDFVGWQFADRQHPGDPNADAPLVWFASFQDFLGTTAQGQIKEHNIDLHLIDWDCVVVDEYHFGAWQGAAREVSSPAVSRTYDDKAARAEAEAEAERAEEVQDLASGGNPRLLAAVPAAGIKEDLDAATLGLSSRNYLLLSGTPFRALTEGEFNEDAIFNWTYPDEQAAKKNWDSNPTRDPQENPYRDLPAMEMWTFALSRITATPVDEGEDGLTDLSGFFEASKVGSEYHFKDPQRVGEFLDMLRGRLSQSAVQKLLTESRPPFPYSDERFAEAVEHTVWFMPSVASVHAMKAALEAHPYFREFLVHAAAGSGAKIGAEAKRPVDAMLARAAKLGKQTITLSVAKLMTGVTVPQWGAILILRSLRSPEAYFQASFRVQSPWVAEVDGRRSIRKSTCFVFDFDPNRALSLMYQYGTKVAGGPTKPPPSQVLGELIDHLPIFLFDGGEMQEVSVNDVMDWGTAGAGAAMLARRWGSPRLIDLSDVVLSRLLGDAALLERLEQIEDFRNLREDVGRIVAHSKTSKKRPVDRPGGGKEEDPDVVAARRERRAQVKALRDKLLKFVQTIPVFMYLTDFREEALVHVIESLDTQLFERVTGLTLADFHRLSEVGVFSPLHMEEAIWQFRLLERASLDYLSLKGEAFSTNRLGLWDRSVTTPLP